MNHYEYFEKRRSLIKYLKNNNIRKKVSENALIKAIAPQKSSLFLDNFNKAKEELKRMDLSLPQMLRERARDEERFENCIKMMLITGEYEKNELEHYFFEIKGQRYVYGIVELVGLIEKSNKLAGKIKSNYRDEEVIKCESDYLYLKSDSNQQIMAVKRKSRL